MKLQKKHIIYATVIGAALAAWGIDAIFFESSPGVSQVAAGPAPVSEPPSPHPSALTEMDSTPRWLCERLRDWSARNPIDPSQARDIFSVPASWAPAHPASAASVASLNTRSAEDFRREHHLTAVVVSGSGGKALVDGKFLAIGQTIAGCRLLAVSNERADFIAPDGRRFHLLIGPEEKSEK